VKRAQQAFLLLLLFSVLIALAVSTVFRLVPSPPFAVGAPRLPRDSAGGAWLIFGARIAG